MRKSRNRSASAAARTSAGTGGSITRTRSASGIDETTCVHGWVVIAPSAAVSTSTARPPACRMRVTGRSRWTLQPAASTSSRQRSHIMPGPSRG